MAWKDYIERMKEKWIGKEVSFEGKKYTVVDVDYNGSLMIDKETYYCESYTGKTTAVDEFQLDK